MYETHVTVVGNVVTAIDKHRFDDGTIVANFRVASTERRYDRAGGGWVDGDKLYVDVKCWRGLAENAVASLVKGDPVVVTGRLFTRTFEHEGQHRSTVTLEAQSVAADLSWCTAVLTRTRRRAAASPGSETRPATQADTHGDDHEREPAPAAEAGRPVAAERSAEEASRLVGAAPGGEG